MEAPLEPSGSTSKYFKVLGFGHLFVNLFVVPTDGIKPEWPRSIVDVIFRLLPGDSELWAGRDSTLEMHAEGSSEEGDVSDGAILIPSSVLPPEAEATSSLMKRELPLYSLTLASSDVHKLVNT